VICLAKLLDSGKRRNFDSGAVRDVVDGKGRCDLLPLLQVSRFLGGDRCLYFMGMYIATGNICFLYNAIGEFSKKAFTDDYTAMLETAKQYEDGAKKYDDRNWEKGMHVHCFIDSAGRHYLKYCRGDKDEPHDRAVLWNLFGAIWTIENHPDLLDIEFRGNVSESTTTKESIEPIFNGFGE